MTETKTTKTIFNPYRHVHSKVRMLLASEARMSADERRACQWTVLVKFCDTYILVGKGDVNTVFMQIGEAGTRRVVYPDTALERLAALGTQPYWMYELRFKESDDREPLWLCSVEEIKRKYPADTCAGARIYGHKLKEKLVYKIASTMQGKEWVASNGT